MREQFNDYFIEQTNGRLERIEGKLDTVLEFRWQIIGGAVVASAFVGLVVSVGIALLAK